MSKTLTQPRFEPVPSDCRKACGVQCKKAVGQNGWAISLTIAGCWWSYAGIPNPRRDPIWGRWKRTWTKSSKTSKTGEADTEVVPVRRGLKYTQKHRLVFDSSQNTLQKIDKFCLPLKKRCSVLTVDLKMNNQLFSRIRDNFHAWSLLQKIFLLFPTFPYSKKKILKRKFLISRIEKNMQN